MREGVKREVKVEAEESGLRAAPKRPRLSPRRARRRRDPSPCPPPSDRPSDSPPPSPASPDPQGPIGIGEGDVFEAFSEEESEEVINLNDFSFTEPAPPGPSDPLGLPTPVDEDVLALTTLWSPPQTEEGGDESKAGARLRGLATAFLGNWPAVEAVCGWVDGSDLFSLRHVSRGFAIAVDRFLRCRLRSVDLHRLLRFHHINSRLRELDKQGPVDLDESQASFCGPARGQELTSASWFQGSRPHVLSLGLQPLAYDAAARLKAVLEAAAKWEGLRSLNGFFLAPVDLCRPGFEGLRSLHLSVGVSDWRPLRQDSAALSRLLRATGPRLEELRLVGMVENRLHSDGLCFPRLRVFDARGVQGVWDRSIVFWLCEVLPNAHLLQELCIPAIREVEESRVGQLERLCQLLSHAPLLETLMMPGYSAPFGSARRAAGQVERLAAVVAGTQGPRLRHLLFSPALSATASLYTASLLRWFLPAFFSLHTLSFPATRPRLMVEYQSFREYDKLSGSHYKVTSVKARRWPKVEAEPILRLSALPVLQNIGLLTAARLSSLELDLSQIHRHVILVILGKCFVHLRALRLWAYEPQVHGKLSCLSRSSRIQRLALQMRPAGEVRLPLHLGLTELELQLGGDEDWDKVAGFVSLRPPLPSATLRSLVLKGRQAAFTQLPLEAFQGLTSVRLHLPDLHRDFFGRAQALPQAQIDIRSLTLHHYDNFRTIH